MVTISFAGETFDDLLQQTQAFLSRVSGSDPLPTDVGPGSGVAVNPEGKRAVPTATADQLNEFFRRLGSQRARDFMKKVARTGRSTPWGAELFAEYDVKNGQAFAGSITTPITKASRHLGRALLAWDPIEHTFTMSAADRAAILSILGAVDGAGSK